ncbi:MAG: hypothetical protein IT331_20275 [Anaerolineae bacterium]|nr:hypothetical protein [Anaerolineae bacterium]
MNDIRFLSPDTIRTAHGGILTGHWEFDLAIALLFFAVICYSFLLPQDAPRGAGRMIIYGGVIACLIGAGILAVLGFRSLALGQ